MRLHNLSISFLSLRGITSNRSLATIYLVVMCIQIVAIEGYGISPLKVVLMGIAPFLFICKTMFVSPALVWSLLYWAWCYFSALFNGEMRFSTIGYLGMFVITYIVFYGLLYKEAFSFEYFKKLLRGLIIAFGVVLILQQIAILVGLRSFWFINLDNQFFLDIDKLPSLTLEPSHTVRILTVAMLCYLRCIEIDNGGIQYTLFALFDKEHRLVIILFLWAMLTMGSGTAFVGLAILSLYFLQRKTLIYIIPVFALLFYISQSIGLSQLDRALRVAKAASTGNVEMVQEEDGSAASRVIPIINTLTIDLSQTESWVGKGIQSKEYAANRWKQTNKLLSVVEQYGLVGLIIGLLLVYTCAIRTFISLETLLFLFLLGFSVGNIAYGWGCLMIFTCSRYFQEQYENRLLTMDENYNKKRYIIE